MVFCGSGGRASVKAVHLPKGFLKKKSEENGACSLFSLLWSLPSKKQTILIGLDIIQDSSLALIELFTGSWELSKGKTKWL